MKKAIMVFMLSVSLVFSSSLLFAEYITSASVQYDSRYYPEFAYGTGGSEGHSGAFISITVAVVGYYDLSNVKISAEHKNPDTNYTDFEVTLRESPLECLFRYPPDWNVEQYWGVRLKPEDWMVGKWEITMKFTDYFGNKGKESVEMEVNRFSFPQEPTGIEFRVQNGVRRIIWNSIGIPGYGDDEHVEYRIIRNLGGTFCAIESIKLDDTDQISLNRIRAIIPDHWASGELIRVENRVYNNSRFDRGVRYFYLP